MEDKNKRQKWNVVKICNVFCATRKDILTDLLHEKALAF